MITLVIYDITDDIIRNRIAKACKQFGLSRIQKSAFLGDLPSARRKELISRLRRILGDSKGNIQIFVLCRADFALREIIGNVEFDEDEEIILV